MKEPVPHFNEPLSLPPETVTNLKSDQRSGIIVDRVIVLIFLPSKRRAGGGEAKLKMN